MSQTRRKRGVESTIEKTRWPAKRNSTATSGREDPRDTCWSTSSYPRRFLFVSLPLSQFIVHIQHPRPIELMCSRFDPLPFQYVTVWPSLEDCPPHAVLCCSRVERRDWCPTLLTPKSPFVRLQRIFVVVDVGIWRALP